MCNPGPPPLLTATYSNDPQVTKLQLNYLYFIQITQHKPLLDILIGIFDPNIVFIPVFITIFSICVYIFFFNIKFYI